MPKKQLPASAYLPGRFACRPCVTERRGVKRCTAEPTVQSEPSTQEQGLPRGYTYMYMLLWRLQYTVGGAPSRFADPTLGCNLRRRKRGLYYVLWPWRPWWSCAARARHDKRAGQPPKNASATGSLKQALTGVAARRASAFHQDLAEGGQLLLQEDAKRCRGKPRGKLRQQDFSGSENGANRDIPSSSRSRCGCSSRRRIAKAAARYVEDDKWEERQTPPSGSRASTTSARGWPDPGGAALPVVVEPFRIGLSVSAEGWQWVLDAVLSILFIMDIVFTFNTAYLETHLEGDNWVIDRGMIAQNYLAWRASTSSCPAPTPLRSSTSSRAISRSTTRGCASCA